ncbi:lysophosphatidic acid receptor 1-A-like [Lethenteron reissneri]|uniref:lysophosphatidic acid receptor 1-A-like n=1 Tax=Lethenteron reissneri TaxID=7753 RepID=UPI002AB70EFB|nr:lysophosphatidic acid receptor 1-A-like [Lethenteron reissneri]
MSNMCHYNGSIEFFYNNSNKELPHEWGTLQVVTLALGIFVSALVLFANGLVIAAVYVNKRFHVPIYYLLGNLAAADLFAGIAYIFLLANTGPNTRNLTVRTWMLRQSLLDTSLTASVANLLAIAIERHVTIFRMQLHTKMSKRRVMVVIVMIWVISVFMGALPSFGWNCICNIKTCSNMAPLYSDSYLIFWATSNLVVFVVMVGLYVHIYVYVRKQTLRMSRHSSLPRKHKETTMNLQKTVSIILGAFVICWTPALVLLLLDVVCKKGCNLYVYEKFFLLLAEFNSGVNPIIYSLRDHEMQSTFLQVLRCRRPLYLATNSEEVQITSLRKNGPKADGNKGEELARIDENLEGSRRGDGGGGLP